jgi:hypothetical protein
MLCLVFWQIISTKNTVIVKEIIKLIIAPTAPYNGRKIMLNRTLEIAPKNTVNVLNHIRFSVRR